MRPAPNPPPNRCPPRRSPCPTPAPSTHPGQIHAREISPRDTAPSGPESAAEVPLPYRPYTSRIHKLLAKFQAAPKQLQPNLDHANIRRIDSSRPRSEERRVGKEGVFR